MRKLKAYLRSSVTTFFEIFLERTQEKWRRVGASTVSRFQRSIPLYLVRINTHLTYSRTMSPKNPEKSLQRSESHLFSSTAQETNRKLLRPSDEEDALFEAGEFGNPNRVALQRTVW